MEDFISSVFGEATWNEIALAGVFFACVVLFGWSPRIGEAIGALLEDRDDGNDDATEP